MSNELDQVMRQLEQARASLIRRARRAMLQYLLKGNAEATTDTVRDLVPSPPGIDARLYGAVAPGLRKDGIIQSAGMKPSKRGHHRKIEVWSLLSEAKARQWLAAHPEIPDPMEPRPRQGNLFDVCGNGGQPC